VTKNKYALPSVAAVILMSVNPVSGDAAAVDAFQKSLNGTMTAGIEGLNLAFTVPDGKQFVIEYASGNCSVLPGEVCTLSILIQNGAGTVEYHLQTANAGSLGWIAGQQVKLYANSGTTVTLRADRNSQTGEAVASMSVSGYLQ
jgi:hypothetical protein